MDPVRCTVELNEEDRQLSVLALALAAVLRPGFDMALGELAAKFGARSLYDDFKRFNSDHRAGPAAARRYTALRAFAEHAGGHVILLPTGSANATVCATGAELDGALDALDTRGSVGA